MSWDFEEQLEDGFQPAASSESVGRVPVAFCRGL
jgi:hypothetical protein